MVKIISSREGGYMISFSENQTEEEWNLIRQAKELERKQKAEQYAEANQPSLKGGIDWNFFKTGKRSQPVSETLKSLLDSDGDGYLNPDEWINIIKDTCIYDNDSHAAFTSLVNWNNNLYVAFREAGSHMGSATDRGRIIVMVYDNKRWETSATFSVDGLDLRDPCFVKWGERLLLYTSYRFSEFTKSGWTELQETKHNAPHSLSIWKIRPYKNELYGIGHRWNMWPILMKSKDGLNWEVVCEYQIGGNATEADLLFVKDKMYVCFRVEIPEGSHSVFGESSYPFSKTKLTEMNISVSSPEMIFASSNTILLSGRELVFDKTTRILERMVSIFAIDKKGNVKGRYVINKEAKDQGYGSFYREDKKRFLMTYYEGTNKTRIHLVSFLINNKFK